MHGQSSMGAYPAQNAAGRGLIAQPGAAQQQQLQKGLVSAQQLGAGASVGAGRGVLPPQVCMCACIFVSCACGVQKI
jgi:hypothetical protein